MEQIKNILDSSMADFFLSKDEESRLRIALTTQYLSPKERVELTRHAVSRASEKADEKNHSYVFKWLKKVSVILGDFGSDEFHNNAYFSHTHDLRERVISIIDAAKLKMEISLFTISDNDISKAITEAHGRGVQVRVVTDDEKVMDRGSDIFRLKHSGIPVKIDSATSLMHHKFLVVDNHKVLTGSYNWTRTASEINNENILVTDNARIVKAFTEEFERLWQQMKNL